MDKLLASTHQQEGHTTIITNALGLLQSLLPEKKQGVIEEASEGEEADDGWKTDSEGGSDEDAKSGEGLEIIKPDSDKN